MKARPPPALSRREREIMDIVYSQGEATAAEVRTALPDRPSYSAVRGLLRVLEEKGHLRHRRQGTRNVYAPVRPRRSAGRSALQQTLQTFFSGDVHQAVSALLDVSRTRLSPRELRQILDLIRKAHEEGR